ncbi:MAG: transglutaminase-like domain-containing protein [Eubacteriales bacterium]
MALAEEEKENPELIYSMVKTEGVDAQNNTLSHQKGDNPVDGNGVEQEVLSPKGETTSNQDGRVQLKANEDKKRETTVDSLTPVIDDSKSNTGVVSVKHFSNKKLKVMVIKGETKYTYDLKGDNKFQDYPLQSGDGTYKVSIMENTSGNKYRYILTVDVSVKTSNPNTQYLTSVQMISWNSSMVPIIKAQSLGNGLSDSRKVAVIYNFITNNIKYDSTLTSFPSDYVPDNEKTYDTKTGICYDFASLTAAMLRSVGVPTKLVKGTGTNVEGYHAWNEVYVNGQWQIVDTSYDSQAKSAGVSVSMYKFPREYNAQKVY